MVDGVATINNMFDGVATLNETMTSTSLHFGITAATECWSAIMIDMMAAEAEPWPFQCEPCTLLHASLAARD